MSSLENRTIGVVEDDPLMGESLVQRLSLEGGSVHWWRSGREAVDAIDADPRLDALICDIRLPDLDGEQILDALSRNTSGLPMMFVTAYGNIDQAVRLMRSGAMDYITKPFDMDQFLGRLQALMRPLVDESELFLGMSPQMRDIETLLERLSRQTAPVLITGETGVGKEVCARHLHALSCPDSPFVAVNCAAIPSDLLESELLGHEKGAFTGAQARHLGYAERAGVGLLFLDEIGAMPLALQTKLLRLVEERSFHRVGGENDVAFHARVVAATNQDLVAAASEGRFREDLLYRLNTFVVHIPPLRERPADIDWLLERFIARFAESSEADVKGLSALAVDAARDHPWPGNARELRNRVERATALAMGQWLMPADLFPPQYSPCAEDRSATPLAEARSAAERRAIKSALRDTSGQISEAARLLGVSRTTLWEKMKRLGLDG